MKKQSFFSRLTGGTDEADEEVTYADDGSEVQQQQRVAHSAPQGADLRVDVYQMEDSIVLKAFTPGVLPNDVELSLTRDMLTISATREEVTEAADEDFFTRELDWGTLERTILLPAEVDIDLAEATELHGVLTIRLPKIQKDRQRTIKVGRGSKSVNVN
jgi:HSP20 family molecular chaperone IbpA